MSGTSNIAITITGVDRSASKTIDDLNKKIEGLNKKVVDLGKKVAGMRPPVERSTAGLTALGKSMRSVAQESLQAFENTARLVGPMGAITSAASIAGMAGLAAEWARFGTQLGFSATRAGISASSLRNLQGAAQLAGSSAEALTSGMTALNDNLFNATAGRAPEAVKAFGYLGVAFHDAAGHSRSAAEALPELADKLAALKDPTMQAQLATMLFGGAAESLLPVLRLGAAGIANLSAVTNRHDHITNDMIDAATRLTKAEVEVGQSVAGFGHKIAYELEPYMTPLLTNLADWIDKNPKIVAGMAAGVGVMGSVIGVLGTLRMAWWAVAGAADAAAVAQTAAAGGGLLKGGLGLLGRLAAPLALLGLTGPAGGEDAAFSERKNQEFLANRRAQAGPRSTPPAALPLVPSGVPGLAGTSFGALLRQGEGGYNSVNRGAAGGYAAGTEDLANKTLAQVMADQASGKYNAAGAYQIIAPTLAAAANQMNLKGNEKFDRALQDKIFSQYLAGSKRPAIANYLSGRSNDLVGAARAASYEWASVADPDTGLSHYAGTGNNRASISVQQIETALAQSRASQTASGGIAPGIGGGTGAAPTETRLTGGADLTIKLNGFPNATNISTNATGNMWANPPRVEQAMAF